MSEAMLVMTSKLVGQKLYRAKQLLKMTACGSWAKCGERSCKSRSIRGLRFCAEHSKQTFSLNALVNEMVFQQLTLHIRASKVMSAS